MQKRGTYTQQKGYLSPPFILYTWKPMGRKTSSYLVQIIKLQKMGPFILYKTNKKLRILIYTEFLYVLIKYFYLRPFINTLFYYGYGITINFNFNYRIILK